MGRAQGAHGGEAASWRAEPEIQKGGRRGGLGCLPGGRVPDLKQRALLTPTIPGSIGVIIGSARKVLACPWQQEKIRENQ